MEGAAAVVMVMLTAALFLIWRSQTRDPTRWRAVFAETRWLRLMAWVGALAVAAAVGSFIGGGDDLALLAIALGTYVLVVLTIFWSYARTFGSPDDR